MGRKSNLPKRILVFATAAALSVLLFACGDVPGINSKYEEDANSNYYCMLGNVRIELGADIEPILDELGEPLGYQEVEVPMYAGKTKVYTYKNICIFAYPNEGKYWVYQIGFLDYTAKTPEGIVLGDAIDVVVLTYGMDVSIKEQPFTYTYPRGNGTLNFEFEDNRVAKIYYLLD